MARRFYRIVIGPTASRDDFLSHQTLDRPLRRATPEVLRTYDGISVFETLMQAREVANRFRALGDHIAEMTIPDETPIRVERTFPDQSGHHTLWGDPDDMLNCVTRIYTLAEQE